MAVIKQKQHWVDSLCVDGIRKFGDDLDHYYGDQGLSVRGYGQRLVFSRQDIEYAEFFDNLPEKTVRFLTKD